MGQLFQIGFACNATSYQGSGVFYDNVHLYKSAGTGVGDALRAGGLELQRGLAEPLPELDAHRLRDRRSAARWTSTVYDITGRRVTTLFRGTADAGSHAATWDGRSADGRLAPAGVYRCVLQTAAGRQSRNLVLSH